MARKSIKKVPVWVIVVVIILVIAIAVSCFIFRKEIADFVNAKINSLEQNENTNTNNGAGDITSAKPSTPGVTISSELSFHFLTLGNSSTGDCIYVKAGENDILIDAGSDDDSIPTIKSYVNQYVTDNTFEYVIITHADNDHIVGFGTDGGIFDSYVCENIIDFPKTNKDTKIYNSYVEKRTNEISEGATHYTALQCYNNEDGAKREIALTDNVSIEVLYNYYYDHSTSNENNFSVCLMFKHGEKQFLFTGDLEKSGEDKLADFYEFSQVELFKAGHHGSSTASNAKLVDEIKPKIFVASCVAGYAEYRQNDPLDYFPAQAVIDRVSKHTQNIYVTSLGVAGENGDIERQDLNGNIVVTSDDVGVEVICTGSTKSFLQSDWYLANRA